MQTRQKCFGLSNVRVLGISMKWRDIRRRTSCLVKSVATIIMRIAKVVRWQKMFVLLATWAIAEFTLNCVGLDDLADYGEFVFERNRACPHQVTTY
ncbi:hypothetical protein IQ235_04170 [Oscillatoriales cyanobacterium LEGE 11467]|uniref:Uncharacterized protein n=2 Tax=Zarconia TaxID=2992130 RepID=A0A928VTI2_9CYAN|nr:hypothetical protein [Zarconia navalis LEGE 11467]